MFAAWLPRKLIEPVIAAELQAVQKGWSDLGALSGAALDREIAKVRRDGIAATTDLPVPGISALSAPVFNHSGHLQLAITVIGPTPKIDVSLQGDMRRYYWPSPVACPNNWGMRARPSGVTTYRRSYRRGG